MIGILVSAPMGPVGVLCVKRTLGKGRWHGFATGLGAVVSDVLYAFLTMMGVSVLLDFIKMHHLTIQLLGCLVLCGFGLHVYRSNPSYALNPKKQGAKTLSYTSDFITGFFLTISNMLIIFLYLGIFARLQFVSKDSSTEHLIIGLASIAMGAILWWFLITTGISHLQKNFDEKHMKRLNKIVGIVVIAVSIIGTISVFI